MILTANYYEVLGRKGILLFHQKSQNASSRQFAHKIFDIFEACYTEVLKDVESTRITSSDDMGDPEIQLLENAKAKALKTLPQSSLYWGSDLYHLHMNSDTAFAKLPLWFKLYRLRDNTCEVLELDKSWTKMIRNKKDSFILTPKMGETLGRRHLGEEDIRKPLSFRIANFVSSPALNLAPAISIDCELESDP
jgi:hypothetical protein